MVNFAEISQAVIIGDNDTVFQLTEKAFSDGVPASEVLNRGLICMSSNSYIPESSPELRGYGGNDKGIRPVPTVILDIPLETGGWRAAPVA
ncbi:MAG: hypothetical protein CL874_03285 [Dehalococcoidales bacterium]|nr:hypothetical protein [Dehalococcoidales bacterium]MDP6449066.1 hypothetical protein [Dehalococcoidales bacterium]MDP6577070.1 hypothetical protein [Dehalococcoidales bacterium]MDP6824502.1 hypothetical protein [Dehalococcoidales bacterium]